MEDSKNQAEFAKCIYFPLIGEHFFAQIESTFLKNDTTIPYFPVLDVVTYSSNTDSGYRL